jgi:hypothetical protein
MADAEDTTAVGESGVEASPSPEEAGALRAAQAQVIMEGLSRLERTVDNAGYAFTALDAIDRSLMSIEAVRGYTHVQFVNVARNQLTDVSVLSELPYLVAANLSENALATPPAFANAYLQSLDVSTNQLATLQGLASASLTSLRINGEYLSRLICRRSSHERQSFLCAIRQSAREPRRTWRAAVAHDPRGRAQLDCGSGSTRDRDAVV